MKTILLALTKSVFISTILDERAFIALTYYCKCPQQVGYKFRLDIRALNSSSAFIRIYCLLSTIPSSILNVCCALYSVLYHVYIVHQIPHVMLLQINCSSTLPVKIKLIHITYYNKIEFSFVKNLTHLKKNNLIKYYNSILVKLCIVWQENVDFYYVFCFFYNCGN